MLKDIDIKESQEIIKSNKDNLKFLIIDVRTPEEFDSGHLEDAVNFDIYSPDFEARYLFVFQ